MVNRSKILGKTYARSKSVLKYRFSMGCANDATDPEKTVYHGGLVPSFKRFCRREAAKMTERATDGVCEALRRCEWPQNGW